MMQIVFDRRQSVVPPPCVVAGRMIDTSAGLLEVATLGPQTGSPLILMSHGMGSWSSLQEIGERLIEQHPTRRIVAWSRPGCGNSPASADEGYDTLIHEARTVLPALMSALGIHRADFLGHSDGATIAMIFAALYPERVGRVIAIAPYAFSDSQTLAGVRALPGRECDSGLAQRLTAQHADAEAAYDRWRQRCLSNGVDGWSALDVLPGMTAPLLLVQGMEDEFASAEQISEIADSVSGPVDWVLLRGQGHFPQHDIPEQIVGLVTLHLGDVRKYASLYG